MTDFSTSSSVDEQYLSHRIFDDLIGAKSLYKSLSCTILPFGRIGTSGIGNFDTYVFSSIEKSLLSICTLVERGLISDGYAILRKVYELAVTDIYLNLKLAEFDEDLLNGAVETMGERFNLGETQVKRWLGSNRFKLAGYDEMYKFVSKHALTKEMSNALSSEIDFGDLRGRFNDYVHHNGMRFVIINDYEVMSGDRIKLLDGFRLDLLYSLAMHLLLYFTINPQFMMSSDYADYMDEGMTPPEGCQYWVNPDLIIFLRNYLVELLPNSTTMLMTESGMTFEDVT